MYVGEVIVNIYKTLSINNWLEDLQPPSSTVYKTVL